MRRGGVALFLLFFCNISFAKFGSCRQLIASAVGFQGAITATLNDRGEYTLWNDGYRYQSQSVEPQFRRQDYTAILGSFGHLNAFSILPQQSNPAGMMAASDDRGVGKFFPSEAGGFPILPPGNGAIDAIHLFRDSLRSRQSQEAPKALEVLEVLTPMQLTFAMGRTLYRCPIRQIPNGRLVGEIKTRMPLGLVRVTKNPPKYHNDDATYDIEVSPESMLDFSDPKRDIRYYLRSAIPGIALVIESPKKLLELPESWILDRVDFLHMVTPDIAVLGNEIGNVLVVDVKKQKLLATPSFPKPVWIQAMAATTIDSNVDVWTIDASDKRLYRWRSQSFSRQFEIQPLLPEGAAPLSVAAVAQAIPDGVSFPREYPTGYFNSYSQGGIRDLFLQRYVVLGDNGKVYGWTDREKVGVDIHTPKWEWVTYDYEQN